MKQVKAKNVVFGELFYSPKHRMFYKRVEQARYTGRWELKPDTVVGEEIGNEAEQLTVAIKPEYWVII